MDVKNYRLLTGNTGFKYLAKKIYCTTSILLAKLLSVILFSYSGHF